MRKRICIGLGLVLIALAGAMAVRRMWPVEGEPTYQGKQLSVWLLNNDGRADEAVRQIGTNAIPTLLKMLRKEDSALVSKLAGPWEAHIASIPYLPAWIRHPAWYRSRALSRYNAAVSGFSILGGDAQQAVPELMGIYKENLVVPSQFTVSRALVPNAALYASRALVAIGPSAAVAIPMFALAATNWNPSVRSDAVWALSDMRLEPEMVLPVLTNSLRDSFFMVRWYAAQGLGNFGSNARPVAPALILSLRDVNPSVREAATNALRKIYSDTDTKAGAK